MTANPESELSTDKQNVTAQSVMPATPELKTGSIILERYKIVEFLGAGGMGSVYQVEDLKSKQMLALKFLNKNQTTESSWKRFENEIRAASKLDHPNLVRVHHSGLLPDGQPYFIMDLVKGDSLSQLLKKHGRLPLDKVIKMFVQVGFALSYAHTNGVIHRDIKPSNIMIQVPTTDTTIGSVVKVVDFGIAKLTGKDDFNQQTLTRTGEIFGSPLYMSPEQCMGTPVDHRTDLYSMGCVIYEALTGAPPLVGDSALSTMMKHQSEIPLTLKEASLGIEFPERIEQIVARLLAKDVNERYQTAQLVTSHLVTFESAPTEARASEEQTQVVDWRLEKKWAVTLGAIVCIAGFFIGLNIPGYQNIITEKPPEWSEITRQKIMAGVDEYSDKSKLALKKSSLTFFEAVANNPEKFSTYSDKHGKRVFKFPPEEIGKMSFIGKEEHLALGNIESPPLFEGIMFEPREQLRHFPQFLSRFRDDDIKFLDLSYIENYALSAPSENLHVDNLIPYVLNLKSICSISLRNAKINPANFNKLEKLPNLCELWLSNINLSGDELVKSKQLSRLKLLALDNMKNAKLVVKEIGKAKEINFCTLRNSDIDIDDIRELSKCERLRFLDLRGNPKVTDDCIILLPAGLHKLNLQYCDITPKSIDSFKRFKKLTDLAITAHLWKPEDVARLRRTVPNVRLSP
ncbi:MAG TPA: serine/threonine protein kinase [Candidatus Melainabacteria bacterium]|nr:serine/threonine protein kinase [Candidatus Melainabacteria bacterium]HIN63902.1 serine/threonine protein kinase [Candidatus Obscuribacterales bacterium]